MINHEMLIILHKKQVFTFTLFFPLITLLFFKIFFRQRVKFELLKNCNIDNIQNWKEFLYDNCEKVIEQSVSCGISMDC